jgi:hypothetical protein
MEVKRWSDGGPEGLGTTRQMVVPWVEEGFLMLGREDGDGRDGLGRARPRREDGRFALMQRAESARRRDVLTVHVRYTPTAGGGKWCWGGEVWVLERVWRFLKSDWGLLLGCPGEQASEEG